MLLLLLSDERCVSYECAAKDISAEGGNTLCFLHTESAIITA